MKRDTYQTVTDKIIAALEAGVKPWQKPWAAPVSVRPLRANGQPYKGINVLLLWSAAQTKGYAASTWMTYKQAAELGGQVRKGERSEMVVFFKMLTKEEPNAATNSIDEKRIPMLREYSVFNVEQIDNLPARFYVKATRHCRATTNASLRQMPSLRRPDLPCRMAAPVLSIARRMT